MTATHPLADLVAADREGPRITLYQPTHRSFPDNQQDPIRFRNLLKEVATSLGDASKSDRLQATFASLHALAEDEAFWTHALDGVAVFAAPGFLKVMRLQRSVKPVAIVADSFHVKPLLRILQSTGRFQVLALNRRSVRLFEGDRDVLDEIPLAEGVPRTIDEALQSDGEGSQRDAQQGDDADAQPRSGGAGERISTRAGSRSGGVHRAHLDTKDVANLEVERFFRAVDRAVTEHHSRVSGLPLILAALPEYHAPFRGLSHNPHLVDPAIAINPEALSADELRARAWELVLPVYEARLAALVDRFGAAQPTGRAID
jgi:hypothetical protein